jgi:hypothetical protein
MELQLCAVCYDARSLGDNRIEQTLLLLEADLKKHDIRLDIIRRQNYEVVHLKSNIDVTPFFIVAKTNFVG